jgi:hypothetical protein
VNALVGSPTIGQPSIWNNTFSSLARYAGKNISVVSGGKLIGNIGVPTNSTDTSTSRNSLNISSVGVIYSVWVW